jgi:hypothetical protein
MASVIVLSPNDQVREVLAALAREEGREVRSTSNVVDALAAARVEPPDVMVVEAFGRNDEIAMFLDVVGCLADLRAMRVAIVYGSATDAGVRYHGRVSYALRAPCSSAEMRAFLRECCSRRARMAARSGVRQRMQLDDDVDEDTKVEKRAPLRTAGKPRT